MVTVYWNLYGLYGSSLSGHMQNAAIQAMKMGYMAPIHSTLLTPLFQECCRNLSGTVGSNLNPTIWKTGIYCILYNPNIKNSHIKLLVICIHLKKLTPDDSSNTFYISLCNFLGIFSYQLQLF
jgi:hypothetical protein